MKRGVLVCVIAGACGGDGDRSYDYLHQLPPPPRRASIPLDPVTPMRFAIGDCVAGKVMFEVGPRPVSTTGHPVGAHNPFGAQREELTRCLSGPPGHVVVELAVDAQHRVTDATVDGDLGGTQARCVEDVAKSLGVVPLDGPRVRCAFGYGAAGDTARTTITVTADQVGIDSPNGLATGVVSQPTPIFATIEQYLELDVEQRSRPPLLQRGPVVVRAVDAAPMTSINRILAITARTQAQPILETTGVGGAWQFVRGPDDGELPVTPVPVGTGDGWVTLRPRHLENPTLAIYLTANQIWLATSIVGELERIDGRDWAELGKRLRAHKGQPLFADYTDLEIAADDAVPFADVRKAIDVAGDAGFPDWSLVPPGQLSVKP